MPEQKINFTVTMTDNSPEVLAGLNNAIARALWAVGAAAQESGTYRRIAPLYYWKYLYLTVPFPSPNIPILQSITHSSSLVTNSRSA